jgi:cytochrome c-type biogenesis protein CcmH
MKRLIVLLCLIAAPLWAVQPDEILDDPVLEARARDISQGLRCLVCRNENIDDSSADLARDLRLLVRERLLAGDDDRQVVDFIVARYGEYVLLKPQTNGSNLLLWAAGPLMLILGVWGALVYVRRREKAETGDETGLSDEEKARLAEIMKE